jgi:hypothetical protein
LKQYLDDCIEMLRFSVSWAYDSGARSLVAILCGFMFLWMVLNFGLAALKIPILSFLVQVVVYIAYLYLAFSVIPYGLKKKGYSPAEYGPIPFLKLILLMILNVITIFLPWTDVRLLALNVILAIAAVGVVLVAIFAKVGILAVLLIPIGLALVLSFAYSALRLMFPCYAFLEGKGILESIKISWAITNGRLTKVYSRLYLTVGFALGGVVMVVLPFLAIFFFLTMVGIVAAAFFSSAQLIGLVMIVMLVIIYSLATPASLFMNTYLMISAYAMLKPPEGVPVAGPVAPGKPALGAPAAPEKPAKPAAKRMAK